MMNRNIGIFGGGSIRILGPVSDVVLFFGCIKAFVLPHAPQKNWTLITDRLYRRYLKIEELDSAKRLMEEIQIVFSNTSSGYIEWDDKILVSQEKTRLNPELDVLSDVFSKYFNSFFYCVDAAKSSYESFKDYPDYKYEPVRIGISNVPHFMLDERRPLSDYDSLGDEEKPFWLR